MLNIYSGLALNKSQMIDDFGNYLAIIDGLGWLKKERKKINNADSRMVWLAMLELLDTQCYCRLGQQTSVAPSISRCLCVFDSLSKY